MRAGTRIALRTGTAAGLVAVGAAAGWVLRPELSTPAPLLHVVERAVPRMAGLEPDSGNLPACDIEKEECDPPENTVVLSDCEHEGDSDCFWWGGADGGRTYLDYGGANWYREEPD